MRVTTVLIWESPPGPNDLPGYSKSCVNDFTTNVLPRGWDIISGDPGGDPDGYFAGLAGDRCCHEAFGLVCVRGHANDGE